MTTSPLSNRAEPWPAFRKRRCERHDRALKRLTAVLAICRDCGGIKEFKEPEMFATLRKRGESRGFATDVASIEVKGRCGHCREA